MAAAPASVKQVTLANAKKAAGGTPPVSCGPGCKRCRRVDLQLLVTLPSIVPKEHSKALAASGYAWMPALHSSYSKVARKATLPVARIARKGYIMVYFKDRACWDVWQVVDYGLTVKKMHQVSTEQYAKLQAGVARSADATAVCSRKAANLTAQMISIEGASSVASVWIAFTDYLWTPGVLARYAANAPATIAGADGKPQQVGLQSLRGRALSPKDILDGKVPACGLALTADNLQKHLVDYVKAAPTSLQKAFAHSSKPLDIERVGKAAACAEQVRAIEKASGPADAPDRYLEKSVLVLVPDPIGVASSHNDLRAEAVQARLRWIGGGPDVNGANVDPKRPWKRQSLLNAAYIRGRVRQNALNNEMQRLGENLQIDKQAISAERYKQIKALAAQGKPVHPAGTTYEPFDQGRAYKVLYPAEYIAKKAEEQATIGAADKIARYNKHLNWKAIDEYNTAWLNQEKAWLNLLAERDLDYVAWMRDPEFNVAIAHDFDDATAISKAKKEREALERDVRDIAARLDATARCYGGGALADASLKFLFGEFDKKMEDRSHHVAAALFKPFSILAKAFEDKDAGTLADGWDTIQGLWDVKGEMKDIWGQVSQPAATAATILSQAAQQITDKMDEIALLPAVAGNNGLKYAVKDVAAKKVVWARAAGIHHYLQTGSPLYSVSVKWNAGAFASAATAPTLKTMALDVGTYIRRKRRATAKARSMAGLSSAIAAGPAKVEITVPLVLDEAKLISIAQKRGEAMLDVVTSDILGRPQGVIRLPESLANAVVTEQSHFSWGKLKTGSTGLNFFVLLLQGNATRAAFLDMHKKGGFDQLDALASLMSSITGVSGALTELAILTMTPSAVNAVGTPLAAELVSTVPKHLMLKYAAGMLAAAGAAFDSAAALMKSFGRKAQGDMDAADAYLNGAFLQGASAVSLGMSSFYAHRAAMLQRLGTEAAHTALARMFSPLLLWRCLTVLGLVLWMAGLGYTIYAAYMEDDVNELYLRRSAFGTGHSQLGYFESLEHEMQAYMALTVGITAEMEWNDEMIGADELTATLKVFQPDPTDVVSVVIEGFSDINKKKLMDIYRGDMPALKKEKPEEKGDAVYVTEKKINVPDGVNAIRMTYFLHKDKKSGAPAIARNELWIED